jgi:SAM-dependent methyltransferase
MDQPPVDPAQYGRSFADVYDSWYPGGDEGEIVEFLRTVLPEGARILELGVGTGRLALPLAAAGFEVVGLDSSPEMLDVLAGKDPASTVQRIRADAGDPHTWGDELSAQPFDCVLAACNLLLNLTAPGAQRACVAASAEVLAPGGVLVCELSTIALPERRMTQRSTSAAVGGLEVVVTTDADPRTGLVSGSHEHRGPTGQVERRWEIRVLDPAQLSEWCEESGRVHSASHAGWGTRMLDEGEATTVTVHTRTSDSAAGTAPRRVRGPAGPRRE